MTGDGILNPRRSSPAWRACAIGRIEADAVGIEALSGALVDAMHAAEDARMKTVTGEQAMEALAGALDAAICELHAACKRLRAERDNVEGTP